MSTSRSKIRVGTLGLRRGEVIARSADAVGMKLVAVCDTREDRLRAVGEQYGVATYTDYDRFLEHDMDAVIVANYFHQHAPFAIRALEAGKHVLSETSACKTLGEGVALARAVEASGRIYMFAENQTYSATIQELKRLCHAGEIGPVRYAEAEYNHPMSWEEQLWRRPGLDHWRQSLPPTYYCSHTMGPLMTITDTMPISVNALAISDPEQQTKTVAVGDPAAVTLCRMSDGSVVRLFGLRLPVHHYYWRLVGTRGMIDTVRGRGLVRIARDEWDCEEGQTTELMYRATYEKQSLEARLAGHGGADYWTLLDFAEAIRSGRQPYLDVYRGLAMCVVGILAWKSAHEDGKPYEVPDYRDEASRRQYENDDWSPWPEDRRPGQPWPSIRGEIRPDPDVVAAAEAYWARTAEVRGSAANDIAGWLRYPDRK